jgi:hypothetical protein
LRCDGTAAAIALRIFLSIALTERACIVVTRTCTCVGSFVAGACIRLLCRATIYAIANTLALGALIFIGALITVVALHTFAEFILWAKCADAVAGFVEVALVFRATTGFPFSSDLVTAGPRHTVTEVRDIAGADRGATEGGVGGSQVGGAIERSTIAIVVLITNACRRSAHSGFMLW